MSEQDQADVAHYRQALANLRGVITDASLVAYIDDLLTAEHPSNKILERLAYYDRIFAEEASLEEIHADPISKGLVVSMGHKLTRLLATTFRDMLAASGAPNYLEMSFSNQFGTDAIAIVIQRVSGQTPGQRVMVLSELLGRARVWVEESARFLHLAHDHLGPATTWRECSEVTCQVNVTLWSEMVDAVPNELPDDYRAAEAQAMADQEAELREEIDDADERDTDAQDTIRVLRAQLAERDKQIEKFPVTMQSIALQLVDPKLPELRIRAWLEEHPDMTPTHRHLWEMLDDPHTDAEKSAFGERALGLLT